MTIYSFACSVHGIMDADLAFGEAPPTLPCGTCEDDARRVFTAPHLSSASPGLTRAVEMAGRTSDSPRLSHSVPEAASSSRASLLDPRHARLPKA